MRKCPTASAGFAATSCTRPTAASAPFCIYQASDAKSIKEHAARVGMPAAEILPITDTVVIRADPEKAAA